MSIRSAGRVRRSHTHRQTDDVKTITPRYVKDMGCKSAGIVPSLQCYKNGLDLFFLGLYLCTLKKNKIYVESVKAQSYMFQSWHFLAP